MIAHYKKKNLFKFLAVWVILSHLGQITFPMTALALTSGPSQPEVQSFEPVGTSQMVDLSTGDFTYNIPLLSVEGHPVSIAYHSSIRMGQEASYVGLGWNLNIGAVTRVMNGIPDDFGEGVDKIKKEFNIKPNETWGLKPKLGLEIAGIDPATGDLNNKFQLSVPIGVFHNSYKGLGFEFGLPILHENSLAGLPLTADLGMSFNSQQGAGLSSTLSFSGIASETVSRERLGKGPKNWSGALGLSATYNSRMGLQKLAF